ncbi:MAG: HtrA protease/chaperone protein [Ignavibacteriae bacterium]|nr:MAG: HtrA protease/chaperone protein [Ignavibacteriota bacterium]
MKLIVATILCSLLLILVLGGCAPSIQYTSMVTPKKSKPATSDVEVFQQGDPLPQYAVVIGEVRIGDTGFSVGCENYDNVVAMAKNRARNAGGDAIQIIEVQYPDMTSTCYRIKARVISYEEPTYPTTWATVSKSEMEFRKLYDSNKDGLDPLEGIWTMTQAGTWRNVSSGMTGSIPSQLSYRLAIFHDTTFPAYDFTAVVLESEYKQWTPGRIKARFRKTAYDRVYEALWYNADYTEEKGNYIIDESGLIKKTQTDYDSRNRYIELTLESIFVKAYPPLSGKASFSHARSLKSAGSGFLISSSGLVVTNYHVIEDASRIEVVFPEKKLIKSASVRLKDSKNDIAILEVKDFSFQEVSTQPIPYSLADLNSIKVGQEVFTLGFPLGDILGTKSRLSTGRINSEYGLQDDPRLFQIANPLQPGNSGGPLFNTKGELVGIVVASLNAKFFYENIGIIPQNVNFAIKVNYLQSLVAMISEGDDILRRRNLLKQAALENQIEQLNPFIIQVRTY